MKIWKSAEWQRISKLRGLKLLLVGIALIPSIYAVIFLSSLWDTYGKINNLPVALVNNDQSAKINGKTQHLGKDLADKLVDEQPLKITEVTSKQAESGLKSGKYYMTITIPKDFTANAGTLLNANPKYSKIKIAQNAGQSFIAEKMTSSAALKIENTVNRSLQKVYNKTILAASKSSKEGFQSAASGTNKLNDGIGQLADGSKELNTGAQTLTTGTSTLASGLAQYTSGVSTVKSGSSTLSSGAQTAATGASQLATGLAALNKSQPTLQQGSAEVASNIQSLLTQLETFSNKMNNKQPGSNETDVDTLILGLDSVTDGFKKIQQMDVPDTTETQKKIQTDSTSLAAGLTQAITGANELSAVVNSEEFKTMAKEHPELAQKIRAATSDVGTGVTASASAGGELKKDLTELKTTLTKLNQSLSALKKLAQEGPKATAKASQTISTLKTTLSESLPKIQKLATGATQVSDGQKQVSSAVSQLNTGAQKLASGNTQLATGATQLDSGLGQLVAKNSQLNSGASKLTSGAQQLTSGTQQAVTALAQLQSGTTTLAEKLADGAIQLEKIHTKSTNVSALTHPVKQSSKNLSKVDNNGTGMTPYMMSVGLFVGMITFSAIYDFKTVAKRPRNGFAWWAQKQAVNVPVWITQAVVITTLLLLVDGLKPKNTPMLYLAALIVAYAFNQLVLLFNTMFGKLGSGLMIIALVLQLSSSAGSYPIELSNGFFQAIHPWVPMTYSVHAFREIISIGGSVAGDLTILLTVGVVSMVLTWGVYHWKLKRNPMLWNDSEV